MLTRLSTPRIPKENVNMDEKSENNIGAAKTPPTALDVALGKTDSDALRTGRRRLHARAGRIRPGHVRRLRSGVSSLLALAGGRHGRATLRGLSAAPAFPLVEHAASHPRRHR